MQSRSSAVVAAPMLTMLLAGLLAACSQEPDQPAAPETTAAPTPSATPAAPAPAATAQTAIPLALRGAWDWTGGTCQADSDLRMEIGAGAINFYESVGTLEGVREEDGAVLLDLAMEGEGMQWRQTTVLRLVEGGRLLESTHEDPSGNGPLRYQRCPDEGTNP